MEEIITRIHPRHLLEESPNRYKRHCVLCGNLVSDQSQFYLCRICKFFFHKECATSLILSNLTIKNPKIHEHTLNFIPRMNTFICNACGEVDELKMNMYTCVPCDFFVHKECIFLPRVIKITRHSHRLFHTFCILDLFSCGVCGGYLNGGFGGYTCIEKGCKYLVHSDCATNSYVWDGKDVGGEPKEESNSEVVDVASFVEIDSRTIRHLSHDHNLIALHIDDEDGEEIGKLLCQSCIFPIEFGSYFCCKECKYALHETCARLPRKMENPLHRHPLTLLLHVGDEGFFTCSVCDRVSCGFMYRCFQEECGFRIDAKCASFHEPFKHPISPYLLFLRQYDNWSLQCNGCSRTSTMTVETEGERNYYDFKCVTLPGLVRYKYDAHPLTLGRDAAWNVTWCEICEEVLNGSHFFYFCDDCGTNIHVDCILGKYPFLKPGHMIKVNGLEFQIALNNRVSRPICDICQCLCQDKLVFINRRHGGVSLCSIKCIKTIKTTGNLTSLAE